MVLLLSVLVLQLLVYEVDIHFTQLFEDAFLSVIFVLSLVHVFAIHSEYYWIFLFLEKYCLLRWVKVLVTERYLAIIRKLIIQ